MQSHAHPRLPFFASRLRLGRDGVEDILPLGQLNAYEEEAMKVPISNFSLPPDCNLLRCDTYRGAARGGCPAPRAVQRQKAGIEEWC